MLEMAKLLKSTMREIGGRERLGACKPSIEVKKTGTLLRRKSPKVMKEKHVKMWQAAHSP